MYVLYEYIQINILIKSMLCGSIGDQLFALSAGALIMLGILGLIYDHGSIEFNIFWILTGVADLLFAVYYSYGEKKDIRKTYEYLETKYKPREPVITNIELSQLPPSAQEESTHPDIENDLAVKNPTVVLSGGKTHRCLHGSVNNQLVV